MKLAPFVVVGALCAGIGFFAGSRLHAPARGDHDAESPSADTAQTVPAPQKTPTPAEPVPEPITTWPALPPPEGSLAAAATDGSDIPCEQRVVQLERVLDQTSNLLATEQARRAEREGRPVQWPENLDDRFEQRQLLEAFSSAFAEGGVPGEITSIDCTEFPCIVYGSVSHPRELNKLFKTPGMTNYGNDERHVGVWRSGTREFSREDAAEGPKKETLFGISLYPPGEQPSQEEDLAKRVRHRQEQMWDASKPAP